VLVVEDTPVNQKVARHLLARFGFRADVAASGHEALRALEQRAYDLVFMDVQMPEMDGLEATRLIRSRWPDLPVRIIAMTANVAPEDVRRCLEAGMDGFLGKPVAVEALAEVLGAATAGLPAPAATGTLVDAQAVDRLCDQIGADNVRELVEMFLDDLRVALPELAEGCRQQDRERVSRTAHKVKSAARSLGAQALGELFHQLESEAEEADWSRLAQLVADADRQHHPTEEMLLTELTPR
jgi:CheY-like chemotaxis protein/HPt (histidine-containing phosphotransfer) domain-containing protein